MYKLQEILGQLYLMWSFMKRTFYYIVIVAGLFGHPCFAQPTLTKGADTATLTKEKLAAVEIEYLRQGEDHFFDRKFGAALQWFRKVIEINPDNAIAHAYCGDILLHLDDVDEALRHFRIAAELKSNPAGELFRIGQIYYIKQDRTKAETYFNKALKADPTLAEAHFYLGLLSFRLGRNRSETLDHLKIFRDERPNFANRDELLKVIALLEDPATKLDSKKDLLSVDPLRLFYRKDDADNSKKQVTVDQTKTDQPASTNTDTQTQNDTQASPDLITDQKTEPTTEDQPGNKTVSQDFISVSKGKGSLFNQALVFKDEDPARSLKILDQAIQENPTDEQLFSLRCEIEFNQAKTKTNQDNSNQGNSNTEENQKVKTDVFDKAIRSCTQAAKLAPNFRNLQNTGRVFEAAQNYDDAWQNYVKALNNKLDVDLAVHTVKLGDTLNGKEQETRAILERLLARRPDHKEGLIILLQKQVHGKNKTGLKLTMERLQSLYKDDAEVLEKLAQSLLEDPDLEDEAIHVLKQYTSAKPDDLRAGLTLAGLYLKQDNEKDALVLLGRLYEDHPTDFDVVRTILVLFVRRNQNMDSAEKIAKQFLDSNPTDEDRQSILEILPDEITKRLHATETGNDSSGKKPSTGDTSNKTGSADDDVSEKTNPSANDADRNNK